MPQQQAVQVWAILANIFCNFQVPDINERAHITYYITLLGAPRALRAGARGKLPEYSGENSSFKILRTINKINENP